MKRFKRIYVEITNVCNLSCFFCPATEREATFMDPEDFKTLAEKISPYTDYIYLHVKGEPLLHPDLGTILDISHRQGLKVNITTNGTLIKKTENVLLEKPAIRQINFSLHCVNGNKKEKIHPEYLDDILSFIEKAKEKTDIIFSLRLWNLEKGKMFQSKNDELLQRIELAFSLPYRIKDMKIPGRGIKIEENIYLNQDVEFQWPDLKNEEIGGEGFCYGLRTQLGILADGTVIPCCLDGEGVISLGNVFQENLSEILNKPKTLNIIEGFSNRYAEEELCKKCGYRTRFG